MPRERVQAHLAAITLWRMCNTVMGAVLVVGASGKVGSALVHFLEQQGALIHAGSRTPQFRTASAPSTRWVHLDLERPETFAPALHGVSAVFMMARPGDERPEATALTFIDAIRRADVKRVVNLTAMGCELRPDFGLRRVELALEASALPWTHLRPNFFMQIFGTGPHYAQIIGRRQIRLPAAGAAISFIDATDVAEVAARCIVEAGHVGHAYTLTGSEALAHTDIAAAISRAASVTVDYVALDEAAARSEFAQTGLPPQNVERLLGFYRIVRSGLAGVVSSDVERVLRRTPRSFVQFASEHAATWAAPWALGRDCRQ